MSKGTDNMLNYIRAVAGAWRSDPRDDAELITSFAETRDETAFATLVDRHGGLVWQTCRHLLGNTSDAEDAFQTVFLALTRKAGRFPVKNLAGWLHRVARRTSLKTRTGSQRRHKLEHDPQVLSQLKAEDTGRAELYLALDEELEALPERLRVPLLLRYLEGKTLEEVASVVGCCRRALGKRLEKGEAILRQRLERRGLTLGILSLPALMGTTNGAPKIPDGLAASTTRAAMAFRAGTLTGGAVDATEKLLRSMSLEKGLWKSWLLVLACVGTLGIGGAGWVAWKMFGDGSDAAKPATPEMPKTFTSQAAAERRRDRVDLYGDPLPDGALARIGTHRFHPGFSGTIDKGGVAFLPDGKTFVSVHGRNFVHFWETATGKELRRLNVPLTCHKVAVSVDGKKLAIVVTGEVQVWDLGAYPPCKLFRVPHEQPDNDVDERVTVAFAPDSKALAVAVRKKAVRLIDAATGNLLQTLAASEDRCHPLAFSLDGKLLAISNTLWEVASGKKLRKLKFDTECGCLAFASDNKTLAVTTGNRGEPGVLSLWDTRTGAEVRPLSKRAGSFIAFLPDGRTLLNVDEKRIRFWDSATGETKTPAEATFKIPNSPYDDPREVGGCFKSWCKWDRICLSPNGKLLAGGDGYLIAMWDAATGREISPEKDIQSPVRALAFSPDGKRLATLAHAHELQLWDADTGRPDRELELFPLGAYRLEPFLDYSDSRWIEGSPRNEEKQELIRWDTRTGKASCVTTLGVSPVPPKRFQAPLIAVSSDGRWQIWQSNSDFEVTLVDRLAQKVVRSFGKKKEQQLNLARVSDDGKSVLFCYSIPDRSEKDSKIEVWSSTTGKQLMSIEAALNSRFAYRDVFSGESSLGVALSPDGRHVAASVGVATAAGVEFRVRLWEVASGTEKVTFQMAGASTSVAWSPDGRFLAVGDDRGNLCLWDVDAERKVRHYNGHRDQVLALAFSPDGHRLASGSVDTTALVWDIRSLPQQETKTLQLPPADNLWAALRKKEIAEAKQAMHLLAQNPDVAVPLLHERLLTPELDYDPKTVTLLLAQLDDNNFGVRNRAEARLTEMGKRIGSALEEALAKKPDPEVVQRIERILEKAFPHGCTILDPEELQAYRGVEVLERIGTPAARQVLADLARSARTELVQTKEAKAALQRLTKPHPATTP